MKIVHVEDFFHPDAGYQLNLLAKLQVADGHDVTIVTAELERMPDQLMAFFGRENIPARDAAFEAATKVKVVRLPMFAYKSGRAIFFFPTVVRRVNAEHPDCVFVHGEDTLTGMCFIWASAFLKYPLVFDCHMVEMASQNPYREYFRRFYRTFVTPIFLKNKIPLIRVVDSTYVEKCLGIPLARTELLSFGTDTTYFKPDSAVRASMRKELGLNPDAFVVLYAGKLDETKGGMILAEALKKKLAAPGKEIEVVVIGNSDGEYGARVEATLNKSENHIVRLPTQRYLDLARYYQMADIAVFAKQCSMSFFEAQACGLPVLFEDNEINLQRTTHGGAFLFRPGDIDDFRKKLIELAALPDSELSSVKNNAREFIRKEYDYVNIARQFTSVIERAVASRLGATRSGTA